MKFSDSGRTHPLLPGAGFYFALTLLLFGTWHLGRHVLNWTDGNLVYGLDDPYIHLSIARALVDHGVYGVSHDVPGFASSSVLWPLLLAGLYAITGALLALPFIIGLLASAGSLWLIEAMGKRSGLSVAGRLLLQLLFLVVTPVHPIIFMGMEHALHLFAVLWVLYLFVPWAQDAKRDRAGGLLVAVAMAIAVLLRYESVLLAIALSGLLLFRRRPAGALLLLSAAAIPVIATGLIMMASGGAFLSNSLLVKGPLLTGTEVISPHSFVYYYLFWPDTQAVHWRLVALALLAIGVMFVTPRDGTGRFHRQLLGAMMVFLALHVLVVRIDHFNRYSAYVVGSVLVVVFLVFLEGLHPLRRRNDAATATAVAPLLLLALFTLWPLLMQGMSMIRHVPALSRNIYEQQFQMGRFLSEHYRNEPVAINDLGLSVYDGGIVPVDLAGLAEKRIAMSRRARNFTTDSIRVICAERDVRIGVLYRSWFIDHFTLPENWIPVEEWILQDNVICGSDTLNFYGLSSGAADTLRTRLRDFRPKLPSRVIVREVGSTEE